MASTRTKGITPKIRLEIFGEDDCTWCHYCGSVASEVDHIVPASRGGGLDIENLVPACAKCNSEKRDKTAVEWQMHRLERGKPWPIPSFFDRMAAMVTSSYGEEMTDWMNSRSWDSYVSTYPHPDDPFLNKWGGGHDSVMQVIMRLRDSFDLVGDAKKILEGIHSGIR